MRKNVTVRTHESTGVEQVAQRRVSQPRRRRLALKAENTKVRAQVGLPISWTH